jgi:hypothetical protein
MLMSRKQMKAIINLQPAKKNQALTRKYLCESLYSIEGTFDALREMTDDDRRILSKVIEIVEKEKELES